MLTELRISNFGVIDQLALRFHPGFTVLTGETGAGKSLLIDALALLLGGRASTEQVRAGAEEARLEAVFSLAPDHPLIEELRREHFLDKDTHDLVVHRVVAASGRNRNYLNANPVPLHFLERLGGTLVDIHGQHDQQSLLSPGMQLEAMDAFGGLHELRAQHRDAYEAWVGHRSAVEAFRRRIEEQRRREDYLRYQVQEIGEANPHIGEDERLEADRQRLANAQRLRELAYHIHERLYGEDGGVLQVLAETVKNLEELGELDVQTRTWKGLCEEAIVQLRELAGQVRDYGERIEDDPGRLVQIEQRLDKLDRLKKKYGGSLAALLEQADVLRGELSEMDVADARLADHMQAMEEAGRREEELARKLSHERGRIAVQFQKQVTRELAALKMEGAKFEVQLERKPDDERGPTGQDHIQFLFTGNPGEPVRALARVASGGELSRVMLAMKTILAGTDRVPILIFDEVDAGVGGPVAELMGARLRALGTHHQVLCVTHWPQVASQAHRHYLVEKETKNARTVTRVRELSGETRETEVARMLGGSVVTKRVRATAAEMMISARKRHRTEQG
ncbi:MAG TPA: DNA repair protein RecN [Nitrospiraceae bacterium]|nr:DNA repair protein RecN [Nitrospiraceae bacterium]